MKLLVIHHRKGQWATWTAGFDDSTESGRRVALEARLAAEHLHADDPDVEVVLLSSDSIDTIRRTHGKYFR